MNTNNYQPECCGTCQLHIKEKKIDGKMFCGAFARKDGKGNTPQVLPHFKCSNGMYTPINEGEQPC